MIAVLISFEAIQIGYSDTIDQNHHIACEEVSPGVRAFIKQGVRIRQLFQAMIEIKNLKMDVQSEDSLKQSVIFVCLSAKSKGITQKVFQNISVPFQKELIYFNIDKLVYGEFPFNRPFVNGNQICFGEGFSQLRQKEELRIALGSVLKDESVIEYIFVERNVNEIKELKKQGFSSIMDSFDVIKFKTLYEQSKSNLYNSKQTQKYQQNQQIVKKFANQRQYVKGLLKTHKQISVKQIVEFQRKNLTIYRLINQLYKPSVYYNISAKSWTKMPKSRQISSYIFHNLSDQQLYIAKASRPKELSNEQDTQVKVLANYLNFLIDRQTYVIPHDKNVSLIKFSKIKCYQNKKAFLNIRPYIQCLKTIDEFGLNREICLQLFLRGTLKGKKVKGIGGLLLYSWLMNQNLTMKALCEQVGLMGVSGMDGQIVFLDQKSIQQQKDELVVVRTDYFSIFNTNNYKVINDTFLLSRSEQILKIQCNQFSQQIIKQMSDLLNLIDQQVMCMIRGLFLYYRWNTKMLNYYEMLLYRMKIIRQKLGVSEMTIKNKDKSLLAMYPELVCLMFPERYDSFMLPLKNVYYPGQYNYQQMMANEKSSQNPYLLYVNKGCSFGIFNLNFNVLTFLQWIKSTSRYQVIEYISMINRSLEEYVIMDKRIKLMSVNDKKTVILVVDHAELYSQLISRPKSVKTVLIYRIKKPTEVQDFGVIGGDVEKKNWFDESQDQLIQMLIKWKNNTSPDVSKFQLYEWVLSSFIRTKCRLYNLSYSDCQSFLWTVHKAIGTNRHRLKQLQQNYKQKCQFLYAFPILKQNQKILFNYHLFQFLHVKQLFIDILQGRWNCKLLTYQNGAVNCMKHIIDNNLATKVVKQLVRKLQSLSLRQLSSHQYKNASNDCLEIIRTLTQTTEQNLIELEPFRYYYSVFTEFVSIKNFNNIELTGFNGKYFVIVDEERMCIENQGDCLTFIRDNLKIVALDVFQNMVMILAYDSQTKLIVVKQFQIVEMPKLVEKECLIWSVYNKHFHQLFYSVEFQKIDFKKIGQQLAVAFLDKEKLLIAIISLIGPQKMQIKQYVFSRPIIFLKFIFTLNNSTSILIATEEQVSIIQMNRAQLPLSYKQLFRVNFGLTKMLAEQDGNYLRLFLYKLHIVQHYVIINNQVISKWRYQLAKNVKTLTFSLGFLYIFYENDDMIDIHAIKNQTLDRIWSYYWVQSNCQTFYIKENFLFLKGSSYTKLVRVRNGEKINALKI